jgi:hypothetical protein
MSKTWMIGASVAAVAAATIAATAVPAAAQGGHRSYHDGWARGSDWDNRAWGWGGGPGFSVGVTVGAPAYDSWRYDTYAADWSYPSGYDYYPAADYAYTYRAAPAYRYGGYADDYRYGEPGLVGARFGSNGDYAFAGSRAWDGRDYCWYDDGWRGAGWYRCGFQLRVGYGWGGPSGWHGWGGGRAVFREGVRERGEFREGVRGGREFREGVRERGEIRGGVRERSEIRGSTRVREGAEFRDNSRTRTSVRERGEVRGSASVRERGDVRASATTRERGSEMQGTTGMRMRGNEGNGRSEVRRNANSESRGNSTVGRGGGSRRGGADFDGGTR